MSMQLTRRTAMAGAALTGSGVLLASCGSEQGGDEAAPVRIHANDATTYQANFNPYSAVPLQGASDLIYESLLISSPIDPDNPDPWLAEEIEWNEDGTHLRVHLREGVRWSDGEVLDADDVEFTYRSIMENPALNTTALDLVGVEKVDAATVDLSFGRTSFAQQADICGRPIVPEHVFSAFDPGTEVIAEPMGSGPYKLERFSEQLYSFVRNEDHWLVEEFEAERLVFPSFTTQTFNTALQGGELDWSGGFVANIDQIFLAPDPDNRRFWYPGSGSVNLTFNLENELWQDVELRRGISLALDRGEITSIAYQDNFGPPHPTGLPRPTYEDYILEEYRDLEFVRDVEQAEQVLDAAGYERGADGIRVAPDGTPLSFSLQIPSGYNDWVTTSLILSEQLAAVGIELTPQGISFENWLEVRDGGRFDVTISTAAAGQNPWYLYRSMLSSEYRTEGDEPVMANFGRWYDEESDRLLEQFAQTEDEDVRREAIGGLQRILVEQMPLLPIIVAPNWFNVNEKEWTGFPSADDPYALGAPTSAGDRVRVLRRITRNRS